MNTARLLMTMFAVALIGLAAPAVAEPPAYTGSILAMAGEWPPPPPKCKKDSDCDDKNACTNDECKNGMCAHKPVTCDDKKSCTRDFCDPKKGCQNVDECPDCKKAKPTVAELWPPNHKLVNVGITGVTDPQGHSVVTTIHGVAQDEPTNARGDGNTCPDAVLGQSTASLRAERSGQGDGRVYHLFFKATNPKGHSCSGEVTVCVPHDQGRGDSCGDGGPLFDSLTCH